jgi:hypothetical protein
MENNIYGFRQIAVSLKILLLSCPNWQFFETFPSFKSQPFELIFVKLLNSIMDIVLYKW